MHRVYSVAGAEIHRAALAVILATFKSHVAIVWDRIVHGSCVGLVYPGVKAFRASTGNPVRLKGVVGRNGFVEIAAVFETVQPYTLSETALSREAVRASLEEELRAALKERLGETGTVLSEYFTASEENGMLTLTLRSECEERIDKETLRP